MFLVYTISLIPQTHYKKTDKNKVQINNVVVTTENIAVVYHISARQTAVVA